MDRRWKSDRLAFTFSLGGCITQNVHATDVQVFDDLINCILLAKAGIRTNLDNRMMSETPPDVACKWACQMEKATRAVLVNKYVELYTTPQDTMRLVLNVTQNLLINVSNMSMNA
jgi:hypothetical protein